MKRHLWNGTISALFLLLLDLTELGNRKRDQDGDNDIGNHVEAVIADTPCKSTLFART